MLVTRFAPSPTGHLHLGHVRSALAGWRRARTAGGKFLLRLEDIDTGRCRPEFALAIERDLAWLGLHHDGPVRVQSQHLDAYARVCDRLRQDGLLYPCFCTRRDIAEAAGAPHGLPPRYPGTCRSLSPKLAQARVAEGRPYALRLDAVQALAQTGPLFWTEEGRPPIPVELPDDVVLARKDATASYHLAVTHDDALQGVTLVTRGIDLFEATHVHRLLQGLLDYPTPLYSHHPLLTDAAGRRLAKRDGAATIGAMRLAGLTREQVIALADGVTRPDGIFLEEASP